MEPLANIWSTRKDVLLIEIATQLTILWLNYGYSHAPEYRLLLTLCAPRVIRHNLLPSLVWFALRLWPDATRIYAFLDRFFPAVQIEHKLGDATVAAAQARAHFDVRSFCLDRVNPDMKNPHHNAAARRLAAINMADAWCARYNLKSYDASMSRRSCKRNADGSRAAMDPKDCCTFTREDYKYDDPEQADFVRHVDTFTHKTLSDANHTLSNDKIHFLYTWNCQAVAGVSDSHDGAPEITYRHNEDGEMITKGVGFDPYVDRNFHFEDDNLTTETWYVDIDLTTWLSLAQLCWYYAFDFVSAQAHNRSLIDLYFFYVIPTKFNFSFPYVGLNRVAYRVGENSGLFSYFLHGYTVPAIKWCVSSLPSFEIATPQVLTVPRLLLLALLFLLFVCSCISKRVYCHKVVQMDVGESRSVVVIIPNCYYYGVGVSCRPFLASAALSHRQPAVLETSRGQKILVERRFTPVDGYSVAYLGSTQACFVTDVALTYARLAAAKSVPTTANVILTASSEGVKLTRQEAAMACELSILELPENSFSVRPYSFEPVDTIVRRDEGKLPKRKMAHHHMNPIISDAAFVHATSRRAALDLIDRRLATPHKAVVDAKAKLTPGLVVLINEFANHVLQELGLKDGNFVPVSEEEYINTRKTKQLEKFVPVQNYYDIDNYDDREGHMKTEIFGNAEKAGRGICTQPPETQAKGGRYSLGYAKGLKGCSWVGCGKNPAEITDQVVRVCASETAKTVTCTDFSSQDATIDHMKRAIELAFLLRLFAEEHHAEIFKWHASDYAGDVIYEGQHFNIDGSRGSGSPFTTYGNTPLTAFYAFVALSCDGHDFDEAYKRLGCYSGDDGITIGLSESGCKKAAEMLGFLVKTEHVNSNVPYLGRIYQDPLGGSPVSMSDPKRTLIRLSTTQQDIANVTPEEVRIGKAICLQVTDKNSDFFGQWSAKILRDTPRGAHTAIVAKMLNNPDKHAFHAINGLKEDVSFTTADGWGEEVFEQQMPGFDWAVFKDWLNQDGPCPTLWSEAPPNVQKLSATGPLEIHAGGIEEDAEITSFDVSKKKNKRTKEEQKDLIQRIKRADKYKEYKEAAHVPDGDAKENKARWKIRHAIEKEV